MPRCQRLGRFGLEPPLVTAFSKLIARLLLETLKHADDASADVIMNAGTLPRLPDERHDAVLSVFADVNCVRPRLVATGLEEPLG